MKVVLTTHDGSVFEQVIEGFNLQEFVEEINKDSHKMIKFGGYGITKSAIKMVDTNGGKN